MVKLRRTDELDFIISKYYENVSNGKSSDPCNYKIICSDEFYLKLNAACNKRFLSTVLTTDKNKSINIENNYLKIEKHSIKIEIDNTIYFDLVEI